MPNIDLRTDFTFDDSYLRAAIAGYDNLIIFSAYDPFHDDPDMPPVQSAVYFPNGFTHDTHCESADCPAPDSNIAAGQPLIYLPDYVSFACHFDCFQRDARQLSATVS